MYKCKLMELCQKKRWDMPEYKSIKHGLPHNPRFTATVKIQDVTFDTPGDQCRSSKEAQNVVAQLAFDHFTGCQAILQSQIQLQMLFPSISGSPSRSNHPVGDGQKPKDVPDLHKNKLQIYAQKHNLDFPTYSSEYDGPPHAHKFKAKVTFCDKTYESPEFSSTVKEAELAAAKVAFDALPCGDTEEDEVLCKNLLQELAHRDGINVIPSYVTKISGPLHMPTFVATVEIGSEVFQGQEAKTKKQAENKAAKVVCKTLIERRKVKEAGVISSSEKFVVPSEQNIQPNAELIVTKDSNAELDAANSFKCAPTLEKVSSPCDIVAPSMGLKYPKDVSLVLENQKPIVEENSVARKTIIYSCNSNMPIPDGASMLPISDDKWVGVTMDLN